MSEEKINDELKNDAQDKAHQEVVLRNILLKNITDKYINFIKSIYELPLMKEAYYDGLKQFDFGMLWIKEAISYSPLRLPRLSE